MRDDRFHHFICIYFVIFYFIFQTFFPSLLNDFHISFRVPLSCTSLSINITERAFKFIFLFLIFLFFWLLNNLVDFEIVFLIWYFLPIRNVYCIICINIYFFFTNLFQLLPLFFLFLTHYISDRRLISYDLGQVIDETGVPCLLANINSPHLEFLAWRFFWIFIIFIVFLFFSSEVLSKY